MCNYCTQGRPSGMCNFCDDATYDMRVLKAMEQLHNILPCFQVWERTGPFGKGPLERNKSMPVDQPALVFNQGRHGLYIGDSDDWFTDRTVSDLKVKTIFNLCPDCTLRHNDDNLTLAVEHGITLIHIPADDSIEFDIVREVCLDGGCLKMIDERLRTGSVLVNCFGGCNRSGAVVVAYLNIIVGMPLLEAFRTANSRRGCILTNYAFRRQLVDAAIELGRPLF